MKLNRHCLGFVIDSKNYLWCSLAILNLSKKPKRDLFYALFSRGHHGVFIGLRSCPRWKSWIPSNFFIPRAADQLLPRILSKSNRRSAPREKFRPEENRLNSWFVFFVSRHSHSCVSLSDKFGKNHCICRTPNPTLTGNHKTCFFFFIYFHTLHKFVTVHALIILSA